VLIGNSSRVFIVTSGRCREGQYRPVLLQQLAKNLVIFVGDLVVVFVGQHQAGDKGQAARVGEAILPVAGDDAVLFQKRDALLELFQRVGPQVHHQQDEVGPAHQVEQLRLRNLPAEGGRIHQLDLVSCGTAVLGFFSFRLYDLRDEIVKGCNWVIG